MELPKGWAKPPLQAGMEVAVSLLYTLTGWRVLGCATAPAAADWMKEEWEQDCSVCTAYQYTANQVPPRETGSVSTAAKQQVGKGDFDQSGFLNLGTSVLV